MANLKQTDPEIFDSIQKELERQRDGLELIASENYTSAAVLEANGCIMTNKYAEGYPGRRYYGGCDYVDIAESLARERAMELFGAEHANVQPHSGSQANMAVYFAELEPGQEPAFGILKTQKPPKEVFYPQNEIMFRFNEEGMTPELYDGKPIALFGVRPCDAKGFNIIERVFIDPKYEDPYWSARRKGSLVFALACNEPLLSCFCNWFDGSPFAKDGDIFVVDLKDHFILEGLSEKGKAFLTKYTETIPVEETDLIKIEELKIKAEAILTEKVDITPLHDKMAAIWDEPIWEEISAKCINCGACTFVCSTCHCFDMADEGKGNKGKRIRLWDSCMFQLFTREASGHNPRGLSTQRVRQRFMHKYNYFMDNYQQHLCTGCGRCVQVCPVNLDVREMIKSVLDYKI